jgi:indole-3-glycerol phosphate synthase
MDILIEAGYEAYQSIQSKTADMDLKRLKEKYGDKITFWGGINIENLVQGTHEENKEDVIYALKYAAPGGGFILGTSNSVAYGSQYENYMTALDIVRNFGNYPIKL